MLETLAPISGVPPRRSLAPTLDQVRLVGLEARKAWPSFRRIGFHEWREKPVFIIGGGPSAASLPLERMRGRGLVVAINKSVLNLLWADAVFTADGSWLTNHAWIVRAFRGHRIAALPPHYRKPWRLGRLDRIRRVEEVGLSDTRKVCHYAGNSGFGAMDMVASRGARRIILVGFDLKGPGHWHGGYEWSCRFGVRDYPDWAAAFEMVAGQLAARGIDVINVNRESAIRCFRYVSFERVVRGDYGRLGAAIDAGTSVVVNPVLGRRLRRPS